MCLNKPQKNCQSMPRPSIETKYLSSLILIRVYIIVIVYRAAGGSIDLLLRCLSRFQIY